MIEIIGIDTNIIIRAFKGDDVCINIINAKIPVISIITEIELLSWPQLSDSDYKRFSAFINEC
ncbi:MAG: hypothetical protein WCF67_24495, partial [Chitinophagaceae bacterium]